MTNVAAFRRMEARKQKQEIFFDMHTDATGNTIKIKNSEALEREQLKVAKN